MDNHLDTDLIILFVEGRCDPNEAKRIESHISRCKQCRTEVEHYRLRSNAAVSDAETASFSDLPTQVMPDVSKTPSPIAGITDTLETMSDGYHILEELPRGGQSVVFKAIQKATKRTVAIKVLLQGTNAPKMARYRFEREIEISASLRHPNIVTIFDSGIAKGQYYYAMEYIQGTRLDDYVRNNKLNIRETMELFRKVVDGVSYAHLKGITHRDLKASNVIVDKDSKPHILDFGIAKIHDTAETTYEGSVMVSMTGQMLGTLAYMAPEQAMGKPGEVDVRTDVYSLGILLYTLLTKQFPYAVVGPVLEIVKNIEEVDPERPRAVSSGISKEVEAIVLKALAKEPERRYQSGAEMKHDIDCWLEGLPITARSNNTLYLLYKIARRHRVAASILFLVFIIYTAAGFQVFDLYLAKRESYLQAATLAENRAVQLREHQELSRKVTFTLFLNAWLSGNRTDAGVFLPILSDLYDPSSKELKAVNIMLSDSPIEMKAETIKNELSNNNQWFAQFIIAEIFRKSERLEAAKQAYKESIGLLPTTNNMEDAWLADLIQSRYDELSEDNQ